VPENILFVDDEENILNALERLFLDYDLRTLKAQNAKEALQLIQKEHIAVLVSDNLMPGMTGLELLSRVKEISPDTVRILMTAYANLATAIDAINKGEVFRFVVKPWDDNVLKDIVDDGVNRYRIVQTLRNADEAKLLSLAQTIELKDQYTRGHCDRVANYALLLAESLSVPRQTRLEIKHGSWLHDCGKIGVPEIILNNAEPLDENAVAIMKKHPLWGADVARQAQLSQVIVNIILYHHERYDGRGYLAGLIGENIPLEARIVAVADVYDAMTTDRPYRKGLKPEEAISILASLKGNVLDPYLVEIFAGRLTDTPSAQDKSIMKGGGEGKR